MKKALVITYYWPPSGGGGVQRWLKFAKYLPEFGWEPIIYTPENPDFEIMDKSLNNDISEKIQILKRPIWEPFKLYRMLLGKNAVQHQGVVEKTSKSIFSKLAIWIRGNYFIPDARVFWVRPSVNYLAKYIKTNNIDLIITTGPPHSMHLIGLELKRRIGIKWMADFRDPWSKWDVLDLLNLSERSRKIHRRQELDVLQNADKVLTVSPSLGISLQELGARSLEIITNGFDFSIQENKITTDKFRISHMGLLNEGRNPIALWEVLNDLCEELPGFADDVEIHLSGTVELTVLNSLDATSIIKERVKYLGYLTHEEVMEAYNQSALLLLLINNTDNGKWILPGKMFEYIGQQKPILALGEPQSDAGRLLEEINYGGCLNYNDSHNIRLKILSIYKSFKDNKPFTTTSDIGKYHRQQLTKSLAACLDQL